MPRLPTFADVAAVRAWVRSAQGAGETVGFVPTMGALHAGHASLVRRAAEECDRVVASVFVNPTQFAPDEDYDRYPRTPEADAALLDDSGADAVFAPTVGAIYPPGDATTVDVGPAALPWEGASRPTHFRGVATVVAKLLVAVPADRAYFGRKDYQQTVVVRRLAADLLLPTEIVVGDTVREADGLAMSSRNAYLSPEQRAAALALPRALTLVRQRHAEGVNDAATLREAAQAILAAEPLVTPEYVAVLADGTVAEVERVEGPAVMVGAVRVGQTRLIDNVRLA